MQLSELLQIRLLTSKQLQSATGQSQATISRELMAFGNDVVRIKKGRLVYYAMAVPAFGVSNSIPIYRTDVAGQNQWIANLRPLPDGEFFIQPEIDNFPIPLLGESGSGYLP